MIAKLLFFFPYKTVTGKLKFSNTILMESCLEIQLFVQMNVRLLPAILFFFIFVWNSRSYHIGMKTLGSLRSSMHISAAGQNGRFRNTEQRRSVYAKLLCLHRQTRTSVVCIFCAPPSMCQPRAHALSCYQIVSSLRSMMLTFSMTALENNI